MIVSSANPWMPCKLCVISGCFAGLLSAIKCHRYLFTFRNSVSCINHVPGGVERGYVNVTFCCDASLLMAFGNAIRFYKQNP